MTEDTRDYRRLWSFEVAAKVAAEAQAAQLRSELDRIHTDAGAWIEVGALAGWVSEPFCYVHGEPELTEEEALEVSFHDGDPDVICIPAVRFLP
jgi:hypothetical protein